MTLSPNNLIWIDLEMTGLDTDNDYIIEVATIVTDSELNILAEGPVIAVHQAEEILDAMVVICLDDMVWIQPVYDVGLSQFYCPSV